MNYLIGLAVLALVAFVIYRFATAGPRQRAAVLRQPFPEAWRQLLTERVAFYSALTDTEKLRFEKQVQLFLAQTRITGIKTSIDDATRLLVACSAVIPIFGFRGGWEYDNLGEVLVFPDAWQLPRDEFQEVAPLEGTLLGSVQNFQTDHYMRLSKAALEQGFRDAKDKQNVGIHEFAHLLDEADGQIDGVPLLMLPRELVPEWRRVMHEEIEQIRAGKSTIGDYGGTSTAEFFAVVLEYFFEKPEQLEQHHPALYELLTRTFRQDPGLRYARFDPRRLLKKAPKRLGRNDPCPCGSGEKFKNCCQRAQEADAA
ncbi:zinc-dependent peptidase [Hymenobacter sp. 15J16-1T3B]|uniref:zinc-dependent peptidase n=1 Tax=Hymenobacter sp. 15J16-1T3B TaxID=2886941 RepID=UPI001D115D3F|nr:zinc-dependent peptidase [Hymenobacter sp. 15J16-1T3B]MCC3160052.1 zinc-dependent peptidase [Hymenobacter sp. 15J16-1T3B]